MPTMSVITNIYLQRRASIIAQATIIKIETLCAPPMRHVGHYPALLRLVVKRKPVALHLSCQTNLTCLSRAQKRARGRIQSVAVHLAPTDN